MNSFNHYSLGSCTEWTYEYCLGIKPNIEKPGFAKVKFSPYFDPTGKINLARGHYDTDYGRISAEWQKTDNYFEYKVSLPVETECEFVFNGMNIINKKIENGSYYFQVSFF